MKEVCFVEPRRSFGHAATLLGGAVYLEPDNNLHLTSASYT